MYVEENIFVLFSNRNRLRTLGLANFHSAEVITHDHRIGSRASARQELFMYTHAHTLFPFQSFPAELCPRRPSAARAPSPSPRAPWSSSTVIQVSILRPVFKAYLRPILWPNYTKQEFLRRAGLYDTMQPKSGPIPTVLHGVVRFKINCLCKRSFNNKQTIDAQNRILKLPTKNYPTLKH
jgi:hypothetical protein